MVPGRPCSVAATLQLVGDRWSLLAAREVLFGNRRFSQIARNTGAPRDRLAARLKSLVADGILEKREYQATRFEYHLTDAGKELLGVLANLMAWGDRWVVDEPPMVLEHHGHQIQPVTVCGVCGQAVSEEDLHLVSRAPGWTVGGPAAQADVKPS
ncbi:helix-turn-helix domain-containing protein [Streptomyces sp. NPDC086777]|uniref:winged helix-turn-helix transcriptional regulator n=1 Tax=Streptomyces sp. NPDC086777 TaxID=3154866 RepID=UPI00344E2821